ncbi:HYR domain-containing protein, partial [Puteibacter caeruleilacunae]
EKPVFSGCPNDQLNVVMDAGKCGATITWTDPTANDNCDGAITPVRSDVTGLNSGDLFPEGTTVISWTATDAAGNVQTCSFTVTVNGDAEAPEITCPEIAANYSTDAGVCSYTGTFVATGIDNCDNEVTLNYSVDGSPITFPYTFPLGSTDVKVLATDDVGLTDECTFTVVVVDNEDPVANCKDITVQLDALGNVNISEDAVNDGSTDACGGLTFDTDITTFDCTDVGPNTVILTVTDANGNSSTCTATVTVQDNTDPFISCKDITIELDEQGVTSITAIELVGDLNDNCSPLEDLEFIASKTDFNCDDVGQNTVVLTVIDGSGNSTSCDAIVTVQDNIDPTITCPENIVVYADQETCTAEGVELGAPETDDNCGVDGVENDAPEIFPLGVTVVTWTVTDLSGNIATCEQEVDVQAYPVAVDDYQFIDEPVAIIMPLENDLDCDDNIDPTSLVTFNGPTHGTITVDSEGNVTYIGEQGYMGPDQFEYIICDTDGLCDTATVVLDVDLNEPPVAVDDYYENLIDGVLTGNVMDNDYDPDGDPIVATLLEEPSHGTATIAPDGTLVYTPGEGFLGIDELEYYICDNGNPVMCDTAVVVINMLEDTDGDLIPDRDDIDDDDDGIVDVLEGDRAIDTDGDGVPDSLDNDSDNDGIMDVVEAQETDDYVAVEEPDTDGDGLADVFDPDQGGKEIIPVDSDGDGVPDYRDIDSDDDGITDLTEANDTDHDGISDIQLSGVDVDQDGVDDEFDTVLNHQSPDNPEGSNSAVQNSDSDMVPDYRDIDSDNDGIVDNIEGQTEADYIPPTGSDTDGDGWDDAYDPDVGGTAFIPTDTDGDEYIDAIDDDTDDDLVPDYIEGSDADMNGMADVIPLGTDSDKDGLDDAYDTVDGSDQPGNELGSNAPLQNTDGDPDRDWRDIDDDEDELLTATDEDINGDGDPTNDDIDEDGHPNYLDADDNRPCAVDIDGDGIINCDDIDDDNDGIIDVNEGFVSEGEVGRDSDGDGYPDYRDIDADGDGIVDIIEAQTTDGYIPPTGNDSDGDGLDDAYDPEDSSGLTPVDTDSDSTPDYLDLDTDDDNVPDSTEGHDADHSATPDTTPTGNDSDGDGLDDAYDTVSDILDPANPEGSNAPLQDTDNDGEPDWRDVDDDGDGKPTGTLEDGDEDGDPTNDDCDEDGIPNYLDDDDDCELIIPNGFSPNDDGINEIWIIRGLTKYPEARVEVYNRWGVKVYEKVGYANTDRWGMPDAYWDGRSDHKMTIGNGKLPAGTYFYILFLEPGLKPHKGFVFINR